MKISDLSIEVGVTDAAIKKRLSRAKISYNSKEDLSEETIQFLRGAFKIESDNEPIVILAKPTKVNGSKPKAKVVKYKKILKDLLPRLPLPMLGLPASYGVYYFSSHFLPTGMAIVEGAGFELIYIGLSVKELSGHKLDLAHKVMIAAVIVSVIYNSIAGFIHFNPEVMKQVPIIWKVALSIIHGAPLAILGYFIARLTLHK